jgi:hypothetical protein
MGLLRRRLSRRGASLSSNNNDRNVGGRRRNKRAGGVNPFIKLVSILCIYLIGAVYTVSKRPDLRSQLNQKFQSLLKGEQTIFQFLSELSPRNMKKKINKKKIVNGDDSSISQPRIRIPCGLIIASASAAAAATDVAVVDNEDKEVLPLTTCIELLLSDDNNNENKKKNGKSFLNEKIFQRYPQFEKYVVVNNNNSNSFIPSGIFHLRMGSMDATIDVSPELHIISESDDDDNDDDEDCDLILGKQFWDNHFTEFKDDELYLSTTTTTTLSETKSETASTTTTPTRSRVMVPYIRIRQPLSFDNNSDNDSSDL